MLETLSPLSTSLGCSPQQVQNWRIGLQNKNIILDPGHGATSQTDLFRQGPQGLREEHVNLRVAHYTGRLLKLLGANVIMTRQKDESVSLEKRVQVAIENKGHLFFSIHHNAAYPNDETLDYPCIFFHSNRNQNLASFFLAQCLAGQFSTFRKMPALVISDQFIFQNGFSVLTQNALNQIPAIISEFSFFSNNLEEGKLLDPFYNQQEAALCVRAIAAFFCHEKTNASACFTSETLVGSKNYDTTPFEWLEGLKTKYGLHFFEPINLLQVDRSHNNQSSELWQLAMGHFEKGEWAKAAECCEKSLIWLANPPFLGPLMKTLILCFDKLDNKAASQLLEFFRSHFMAVVDSDT